MRDGNKLARVQQEANRILERLAGDPSFGWASYEHTPCYRLVLAFTDGRPPSWIVDTASAELRPYLAFVQAQRSAAYRKQALDALLKATSEASEEGVVMSENTDKAFDLCVASASDAEAVLAAMPPAYRPLVRVVTGPVPRPIPESR